MNEAINDSSRLVAQAIDALKYELKDDLPDAWSHERNIKEAIDLLEVALEKLAASI